MEFVGWLSSAILIATIATQVHKQWKERSSVGVSRWLFVGQTAASLGFTVYSAMVRNWVCVVTNSIMLASAIVGWVILWRNKRHDARRRAAAAPGEAHSPGARVSSASA
jgi:uncharacterized protein with PQ loop repeat